MLVYFRGVGAGNIIGLKKNHDIADVTVTGPTGTYPFASFWSKAGNLFKPLGFLIEHPDSILPERVHNAPREHRPHSLDEA